MPSAGPTRRRADAERNTAAILDAAAELLARAPDVGVGDIAKAAGVGRVTVYAHFPSREDLVRAVLARAIEESMAAIAGAASSDGPAEEAFSRLVRDGWPVLSRYGRLHEAAVRALPAEEVREHHDRPLEAVRALVERGRADGAFRTDLDTDWLVTTVYALLHAAADEVAAGKLDRGRAAGVLRTTLLSVLRPAPSGTGPESA
ncbi:TetR/AcrR family transcriptional regulator [Actinomadura logoneensis]|uniref:TetR/AcrR family transcriptional regulator n=1 Tax=Actinomadura logoneensis TaxID=2293572 RepID=A0A372JC95_9ACTN|nr:TetR/AcrR family transcriptional regulator [Actinomadura logoneensis]RFU37446.1 TetR/AcrR family transcriptional regulator [Actinomadura logoneensis]